MNGFWNKLSTLIKAHANDVLDKQIDKNSVPVVTQYIRDLESAMADAEHQAAAAAANVQTITRKRDALQAAVNEDFERGKAWKAQNNDEKAREVAVRIHNNQQQLTQLNSQLNDAKNMSDEFDKQVKLIQNKHEEMVNQLNMLRSKVGTAEALQRTTKSLETVHNALDSTSGAGIDNLMERADAQSDLAREEFNRTTAKMQPEEDPLASKAVDDILNSFQEPVVK